MNLLRSSLVASLVAAAAFTAIPASPAHAAELGGSPVSGVCMLSREAVFAQSKIGKAASARLAQLAEQARNQLAEERKPLDADIQAFQHKASTLSEAQREQQGVALQQRMKAFQTQATEQNDRLQLTRNKAMEQIGQDAQSAVATAYTSHRCGLLLNRDAALGGNMTNDLTTDVVAGLDRKVTTISFNLEPLPSKGAPVNGAPR